MQKKKKIDVKTAAIIARKYLEELTGIQNATVEETVSSEGFWIITLGYVEPNKLFPDKNYKVFKVDGSSGEVVSMEIKDISKE
ncbi:MAG: hypothetical protein HWN67_14060 [Candidatus Helarchaeota archaeon]|nr:hypothetical protein [Candidatus Helarchaeota archaeon]